MSARLLRVPVGGRTRPDRPLPAAGDRLAHDLARRIADRATQLDCVMRLDEERPRMRAVVTTHVRATPRFREADDVKAGATGHERRTRRRNTSWRSRCGAHHRAG